MGGYGSTRWDYHRRRCTVEESYKLSVRELSSCLRDFASRPYLWPAAPRCLTVRWTRAGTLLAGVTASFGERLPRTTSVYGDSAPARETRRSVTLTYSIARDGHSGPVMRSQQIAELVGRAMRFGGVRWWIACPCCGELRSALYLPTISGAREWACRQCFGLKYHSQRLEPTARIERRMRQLTRRVGSDSFLEFPYAKPKWMRCATFSRHYSAWMRAHEARDVAFCVRAYALLKRINPSLGESWNANP